MDLADRGKPPRGGRRYERDLVGLERLHRSSSRVLLEILEVSPPRLPFSGSDE